MRYASIRKMDISNGKGIGISLFVQGCHFHCKNCFNKTAWDFNGGNEWTSEIKEEFLKLADKPHITRITLLGGEPLCDENLYSILSLVSDIRKKYGYSKKIWIYTGYDYDKILSSIEYNDCLRRYIISECDVLVDGLFVDELKDLNLKWRGSSNQRIIDIQKSIDESKIILYCN